MAYCLGYRDSGIQKQGWVSVLSETLSCFLAFLHLASLYVSRPLPPVSRALHPKPKALHLRPYISPAFSLKGSVELCRFLFHVYSFVLLVLKEEWESEGRYEYSVYIMVVI